MKFHPSIEEFRELSATYNAIPVYTEIPVDLETPISIYLKLVEEGQGFMLESAESGKNFGRYSFIGFDPFMEITGRRDEATFIEKGVSIKRAGNPLEHLREYQKEFTVPQLPGQPPFLCGGVGYFAYDIVSTFERVRGYKLPDDLELLRLLFCKQLVVFDHLNHSLKIVCLALTEGSADIEKVYQEARKMLQATVNKVHETHPRRISDPSVPDKAEIAAILEEQGDREKRYVSMVRRAKEHISAGDIFQVVLSQEYTLKLHHHPFNLYRRLRRLNPSPYMFYLNFGENQLVGASPEMLVKVENGKVLTCPIAGTCPRGVDEAEDERFAAELLSDIKERAEHAMLVDLGRNDLGRVSVPGTVRVDRFMEVEKFSHVMHLVSLVSGELAEKYSALEALIACFPAGTLSGAPKVRAMEIIHDLEGDNRRAYGGAVGYLDFRGTMDTCITIRTMAINDGKVTVRTGAGIVHDSVPEKEYQETLQKARAIFKILSEGDR